MVPGVLNQLCWECSTCIFELRMVKQGFEGKRDGNKSFWDLIETLWRYQAASLMAFFFPLFFSIPGALLKCFTDAT